MQALQAGKWEQGTVVTVWESSRRDRRTGKNKREVLIRLVHGAVWLPLERGSAVVRFASRSDAAEASKPTSTLEIFRTPVNKDSGGMKITDLLDGTALAQKNQVQRAKSTDGESLLSAETKAMFGAVMREDMDELEELLSRGADITARNGQGQTMAEVALERGKDKSVRWLQDAGKIAERLIAERVGQPDQETEASAGGSAQGTGSPTAQSVAAAHLLQATKGSTLAGVARTVVVGVTRMTSTASTQALAPVGGNGPDADGTSAAPEATAAPATATADSCFHGSEQSEGCVV